MQTGYSGTITQNTGNTITIGSSGFVQAAGNFISNPSDSFTDAGNFSLTGGTFKRFTGSGTIGSPYLIYDVYGLQGVTDFTGTSGSHKYFQLNNNIDASVAASWNSGQGFKPIFPGNISAYASFDGNNHTISNLYINTEVSHSGLFAGADMTVQNLGIINANVTVDGTAGILYGGWWGSPSFTATNCYTTGVITCNSTCGGLIGEGYHAIISNSYSTATVNSGPNDLSVGGLVGALLGTTDPAIASISNSYYSGTVNSGSGSSYVGGLAGYVGLNSRISNSYSVGTLNAGSNSVYVGGLVGEGDIAGYAVSTIIASYSTMDVIAGAGSSYVGGLVGYNNAWQTITDSYSTGSVTANNSTNVGGLVGQNDTGGVISNSYSTGIVTSAGGTNVGGFIGQNLSNSSNIKNNSWYTGSYSNAVGYDSNNSNNPDSTLTTKTYGYDASSINSFYGSTYSVYTAGAHAWDFTTPIWTANGSYYPYLSWQTVPVTTASATSNGSSYTVTLSCSTPSCVIHYCQDTANACTPTTVYSTSFAVSTAGTSYVRYYSAQGSAIETTKSQTLNISSTVLTSSVNPTTYGQSTKLTATVTPSSATGTITFKDGSTTIGTVTLGHGSGSLITSSLSVGSHSLTVVYGGDSNDTGSTSNTVTQTVNQATSSTVLTSSVNPTTYGQSTKLTATVTPSTATGTITFKDGSTTIGTGTMGNGSGTLTISGLGGGSHSLTAVYGGNVNFLASTSDTLTQVVNRATTSTTLTSSANPGTFGSPVTLTATVASLLSDATGTVSFAEGSYPLGTGTIGNGSGTIIFPLGVGSYPVIATYSGDANDLGSVSPQITQTISLPVGTTPAVTQGGGGSSRRASSSPSTNTPSIPSVSAPSIPPTVSPPPSSPGAILLQHALARRNARAAQLMSNVAKRRAARLTKMGKK